MTDRDNNRNKSTVTSHHIATLFFVVVAGFFLWTEHQAHIMGAMPYLVLLLCPLMHFFMHRGHGGHGKGHGSHDGHDQSHSIKGDES